jgi:hypothetical protein
MIKTKGVSKLVLHMYLKNDARGRSFSLTIGVRVRIKKNSATYFCPHQARQSPKSNNFSHAVTGASVLAAFLQTGDLMGAR